MNASIGQSFASTDGVGSSHRDFSANMELLEARVEHENDVSSIEDKIELEMSRARGFRQSVECSKCRHLGT